MLDISREDMMGYIAQNPLFIADLLLALPQEDLPAILRQVFIVRTPNPEEAAYNENRYFLGTASRLLDEDGTTWGAWELQAVAYNDDAYYHDSTDISPSTWRGPDWGFCQFGTCQRCNATVRSHRKNGVCPICGEQLSMT